MKIMKLCKNEYIIHGDYAEMIIVNKNNEFVCKALVDTEDIERLRHYCWRYSKSSNYVFAIRKSLGRFIVNYDGTMYVDHINGNPLDNRKCNLRLADSEQSVQNRTTPISNKTGFRGVRVRKYTHVTRYQAYITYKKKQINLGSYDTFEKAKEARKEAELKYFGEYARGDE